MIVFRVSGFIMDPVISTFPKILYTSDVMDALKVSTWLSREHMNNTKRKEKKRNKITRLEESYRSSIVILWRNV